jgi:hypothetical protein
MQIAGLGGTVRHVSVVSTTVTTGGDEMGRSRGATDYASDDHGADVPGEEGGERG